MIDFCYPAKQGWTDRSATTEKRVAIIYEHCYVEYSVADGCMSFAGPI